MKHTASISRLLDGDVLYRPDPGPGPIPEPDPPEPAPQPFPIPPIPPEPPVSSIAPASTFGISDGQFPSEDLWAPICGI